MSDPVFDRELETIRQVVSEASKLPVALESAVTFMGTLGSSPKDPAEERTQAIHRSVETLDAWLDRRRALLDDVPDELEGAVSQLAPKIRRAGTGLASIRDETDRADPILWDDLLVEVQELVELGDPLETVETIVRRTRRARDLVEETADDVTGDGGPLADATATALGTALSERLDADARTPWEGLEAAHKAERFAEALSRDRGLVQDWFARAEETMRDRDVAPAVEAGLARHWRSVLEHALAYGPPDSDDTGWVLARFRARFDALSGLERARRALDALESTPAASEALGDLESRLDGWSRQVAGTASLDGHETVEGQVDAVAELLESWVRLSGTLEGDDLRTEALRDIVRTATSLRHPGLVAPRLTSLSEAVRTADSFGPDALDAIRSDLDFLADRERMLLEVELPRVMGLRLVDGLESALANRAADIIRRRPDTGSEQALNEYLSGKVHRDFARDPRARALLESVASTLAGAVPKRPSGPSFEDTLKSVVARELERRPVTTFDSLQLNLAGRGAEAALSSVVEALEEEGRAITDRDAGLVARPLASEPRPSELFDLRRRLDRVAEKEDASRFLGEVLDRRGVPDRDP